MYIIISNNNLLLININIFDNYDTIKLEFSNTSYLYLHDDFGINKTILWDNSNIYRKIFVYNKINNHIQIIKTNIYKALFFAEIVNIKYDIIYIYFICNKYYSNYICLKTYYLLSTDSIRSKKLFNCRDYYRIYSFI